MKKSKKVIIMGAILMSLTLSVGCSSRSGEVNIVDGDTIDRLPEDQRDTEIDKALAIIRKARKDSVTVKDGSTTIISDNGSNLPGQSENIPDFSNEPMENWKQLSEVTHDYIENELKIPKRPIYEYDTSICIDPRINEIYDVDDKGVASGYDNENIMTYEYETEKDDIYSYLILVRDSKDSPWKIVHNGNSYKK
ncbi:hypothetical protein CHL78_014370 [Romboutsia weinsteinii]|uniref:DUF4829 domain-containing protein n=1 Tax=Romboutsia weinsteinii TaxID=2020949 RepID=A0A371J0T1_9FIRM|nr:hypothetical protein [Romboutsia weinsteinii]RDY26278.1 hypothetical protein CHL78_014370 [Romboutsia weinsteinii]